MKRIYETFPVISTIEVFVATNCQEDFRQKTDKQKNKQTTPSCSQYFFNILNYFRDIFTVGSYLIFFICVTSLQLIEV